MVTITNVRKNVILVVNNYEIIILAVKKSLDMYQILMLGKELWGNFAL